MPLGPWEPIFRGVMQDTWQLGSMAAFAVACAVGWLPCQAEPTQPPHLTALSYNIHYAVGMDGKTDLARIIRDSKAGIVGLQEISNKAMAEELGRLTKMKAVFGRSKEKDSQYGDAILCRYPFTYVGNESIPSASSSRYQAMAVDVDVSEVFGGDTKVRFVNTHFDWLKSIGSQEARLAACRVIERAFFADYKGPAILAGDLNAVPKSAPLQRLGELGWFFTDLGKPRRTIGAPKPDRQIDYLLVRPSRAWHVWTIKVMDEPVASDHLPIKMRLSLEGR